MHYKLYCNAWVYKDNYNNFLNSLCARNTMQAGLSGQLFKFSVLRLFETALENQEFGLRRSVQRQKQARRLKFWIK